MTKQEFSYGIWPNGSYVVFPVSAKTERGTIDWESVHSDTYAGRGRGLAEFQFTNGITGKTDWEAIARDLAAWRC
jgi:hypothetical protein